MKLVNFAIDVGNVYILIVSIPDINLKTSYEICKHELTFVNRYVELYYKCQYNYQNYDKINAYVNYWKCISYLCEWLTLFWNLEANTYIYVTYLLEKHFPAILFQKCNILHLQIHKHLHMYVRITKGKMLKIYTNYAHVGHTLTCLFQLTLSIIYLYFIFYWTDLILFTFFSYVFQFELFRKIIRKRRYLFWLRR